MVAKDSMSDAERAEYVADQIEIALAAPAAWERTSKRLPNDIREDVIKEIRVRKLELQRIRAIKTAVEEDARPKEFDAMLDAVIDAMTVIAANVEIFKWERVGQRGAGKAEYKQRVASIPVLNGVIAFQHKAPFNKS